MDNLTPLQAHVLAYFLSHGGRDFSMVGRWWPHAELALVMGDKMRIAVRPFGKAAQDAATPVAEALSEHMLARGGFSTKEQKFGGTMHQFQPEEFRAALDAIEAESAVLKLAATGGATFWEQAFAGLVEQETGQ
jgi:hypothetical protein